MREIEKNQAHTLVYTGKEALLATDAKTGKTIFYSLSSGRERTCRCTPLQRLVVGTDTEIEAEKAKADAQYAPIKAAEEAERKAKREAARAAAREALKARAKSKQ